MGNYIFLNRSNLSIAMDLSAWHVEASPLLDSILSRATYPGAPSYGGVRTWVESSYHNTRAI